jgi:hypothetical protein
METEFDLYTAWLEVQMELEELERKFFEELKGMKNGNELLRGRAGQGNSDSGVETSYPED